MKVQKLNEAYDYKEATNPGRGACCPTAADYTDWIQQALDNIDDPRYTKSCNNQLSYCAKNLLDCKQEFENFNNYWNERFPAMMEYLDNQLSMIPSDMLASLSSVNEDLSHRIRKNDLEGGDGSYWASEDNIDIDIQDREEHTHEFGTTTNQWGRSFIGDKKNKQPKVASKTWGRVWKDGKFDRSFEGPKYQVRAEMAKYLDNK